MTSFARPLEHESKLDRSRPFLEDLEAHGWKQTDEFLRKFVVEM